MRYRHPRPVRGWLAVALAAFAALAPVGGPASAQDRRDPATVTLASDLRASPDAGAAVIGTLAAGAEVSVLAMRGPQAQVDTGALVGWMPMAKLRIGSGARAADSGGGSGGASLLRGLTGLLGGGGGSGGGDSKVPIGVRGLQREDVAGAIPDPAAVDRLEAYRVSAEEIVGHAHLAGLESREVAYPPPPASSARTGAATGSGGGSRGDR